LSSPEKFAIAIDLGTTTIAAALVDLAAGSIVASGGGLNPQRQYGLDVIARLEYAGRSPENLLRLQQLVNSELARILAELLLQAGAAAESVAMVAIAGNPTMSHLLLGLPVDTLARPPYRPKSTAAHRLMTGDLGWHLNLPLYVFPSPGGFVGGDTVAFLYGQGIRGSRIEERGTRNGELGARNEERGTGRGTGEPEEYACSRTSNLVPVSCLYLDLGTNGEIALLADGRLYATSAAAGPAFEGGNLSCGMAALPGAIDAVAARDGRLVLHTLAGRPPLGLCGSGVLDTIALLLGEGLLDAAGGLLDPAQVASPLGTRLQELNGERHFVIYRDAASLVALSQTDIRQVQLAKGAVRAGMEVLFSRAGISGDSVAAVVITGSFGASLALASLKSVGVLTENMVKNARFVREGALAGVAGSLTDPAAAAAVEVLANEMKIIPLSGTPGFEKQFIEQINFPPTK